MRKLCCFVLALITATSLAGCKANASDYKRICCAFLSISGEESRDKYLDFVLQNTDISIRDEVQAYLEATNYAATVNVSYKTINVSNTGSDVTCLGIATLSASDVSRTVITDFKFSKGLLVDYNISVKEMFTEFWG